MIERHLIKLIEQSLKRFPAVLLIGARQVGKSTLAEQLIQHGLLDYYVSLDDLNHLEAARGDPDGFLASFGSRVAIDEVQHVPDLMRALKFSIDKKRQNGRYLLTGSANILAYPRVKESLAGRVDVIYLEGLSLGEQLRQPKSSTLLSDLFSYQTSEKFITHCRQRMKMIPKLTLQMIFKAIFYGGFPSIVLTNDPYFNARWFSAYQTTYLERDVRDIGKLVDIIPFTKLLRLITLRTSNLLVNANLAKDVGIDQRTIVRYLGMLELTFQCHRLMPWHANINKRLIKTPKIFCNDSGFACYFFGISDIQQLHTSPFLGALAETWLWSEFRKLLIFHPEIHSSFYRTYAGREIDFVLNRGNQYVGIEFKFARTVSSNDFAGLKDMQSEVDNMLGVVLYTGDQLAAFSDKLIAVPLNLIL
ncbi:MAG: ATPase [Gammaproteobacteria bacterium RIFCSPHIGHO2_12_FULL_37_34]|nr:MAG: ATPase [Gammaproteobacteria bacterium RIFCSPHIGHO2_12_FULL_37_34]